MRRHSGFTLLEILLVLVLVSLASVAVISTLPVSSEDGAKQQAQSLFHRVQLLNEEAILSGRDFGLYVDEKKSSYDFLHLNSEGWQKLEHSIPAQTELEDDISIALELGGSVWNNKERLFNPGSLFDEDMFAELEQDEKKLPPPQVFIMSSGEVTPFSIAIYPQQSSVERDAWRIVAKENGQIILLAPGEKDEQS